jgi:hypothetical protein
MAPRACILVVDGEPPVPKGQLTDERLEEYCGDDYV